MNNKEGRPNDFCLPLFTNLIITKPIIGQRTKFSLQRQAAVFLFCRGKTNAIARKKVFSPEVKNSSPNGRNGGLE